ncbi:MAG TPA: carbamoyltransferase C-terminal domain-containing protein [Chloroflexota bacterium]|nr:carbamoyltransferase C-terminal domain-containing protein [Chloroflexota bacterium]
MYTLGINSAFHDSSACLICDGVIVSAAEEERFTRVKHGKRPTPFSAYELPYHAIDYCLQEANLRLVDVQHVAYSFDPFQLLARRNADRRLVLPLEPSSVEATPSWESPWEPLFLSYVVNAPRQLASGAPHHLRSRFEGARPDGPYTWHFVDHHLTHAASAFHASPFDRAAVLTVDGRGERATTSYSLGSGRELEQIGRVEMPNSLGLLYEQVTAYLGFLRASDEYKVMALAAFGTPRYLAEFHRIVERAPDGQFVVHQVDFGPLFGPGRARNGAWEQRHFDVAASLQRVLEETVLEVARWLHERTRAENLCVAGGVGLNCVMNARLRDEGPFRRMWVQPAAGDAGTSLGAALWVDAHERAGAERCYRMDDVFLGPSFSDDEIERFLTWAKIPFRRLEDVPRETAEILAEDKIVGWFQGRMEFGPRALGARSILASPIHASMQERLNEIKDREDFRPVAPVVLEEEAPNWFRGAATSPFMLFVHEVLPEVADRIPAVRHIDGTARIQTINRSQHPVYYDLVRAFSRRTGVPILVNTSFNTRGEPIVCTPRDAVECFWSSPLDALAIGSFLVTKAELRR